MFRRRGQNIHGEKALISGLDLSHSATVEGIIDINMIERTIREDSHFIVNRGIDPPLVIAVPQ